ncbi:MAG: septum formation initiator family protein [Spirochaetes bacterium]|nr:septum formation initiator family protein [Spirochaetota bacterium]
MIKKNKIKFIFLSVFIIYIFIFSDIGIISKIKLDQKIKSNSLKLEQLQIENDKLKSQIKKLKTDYNYIADVARKLGYAKKGEQIFRFLEPSTNTNILQSTNSYSGRLKLKNYLLYLITFAVVLAIYITLLLINRTNNNKK